MKSTNHIGPALFNALKKPSVLVLIFTFCFAFWFNDLLKPYQPHKNETNFVWDATGYYSYLPAFFYNHGSFEFDYAYARFLPKNAHDLRHPKYTYGVALMESPFFGIGSVVARLQRQPTTGFSLPYADSVRWGAITYLMIGLFFLRAFLLHFFNETITAISLFACVFASMLYMYAFIQGEISHSYLFCLFSIFLYLTLRWHQQPGRFNNICIACVLGLISIIRLTEVYILLVFVLWNVNNLQDLKKKVVFFSQHVLKLLWFPVFILIFWIPQVLFWKFLHGSYYFDPYAAEHFFWKDPQITNVLFSYRKGWITYTPLVTLALAGIVCVKPNFPLARLSFLVIVAFTVYLFSCWWDWNYGGCFGSRPFCPLIALLVIPLASLANFVLYANYPKLSKQILPALLFIFIFSCACLNVGQSYQFQEQRKLHPFGMTRYVYWEIFRQFHYETKWEGLVYSKLVFPDHESWINGLGRDDINTK